MGLVIPWSLTLAVVDAFSIFVKRPPRQVAIMSVVTIGDWVCTSLDYLNICNSLHKFLMY